jgi:hypothetical protein
MTLSLLIWPALPWAQEIYKSVDAAGHVTYSDHPDASNSAVDVDPGNDGSLVAGMSASTAPPPLPTDDQPPCPEEGYLWTPGYWTWNGAAYDWVPGVWVSPPRVGVLWTPGYWAYASTAFVFHRGYWGPVVGYYGGINYGFGYRGVGYVGGHWLDNTFAYNRAVNNVNANVFRHVYDEPVINRGGVSRVSYNGGAGGTSSVPTAQERLAAQSSLSSSPQRMHVQPGPSPARAIGSNTTQPAFAPRPVVSQAPAASIPRRVTASAAIQPRVAVNTAIRPAPTPPIAPRLRPAPAIKSIPIK